MSQDIKNQKITSLKYTAITSRLRQNERKYGFGMFVAGDSVHALQICFVALVLLFIAT